MITIDKLKSMCIRYGFDLTEQQAEIITRYCVLLTDKNKTINLTRNDNDDDMIEKNVIDCLYAAKYIPSGKKVIDIGSGAGLPGIIIAAIRDTEVLMIDSIEKKTEFINDICRELQLKNAHAITSRAEILGRDKEHREYYDIAVSRAMCSLNSLLEYGMPFLKVNGYLLAMKGPNADEEVIKAQNALKQLGSEIEDKIKYTLRNDIERNIIKVRKTKRTDDMYPRSTKSIIKRSL